MVGINRVLVVSRKEDKKVNINAYVCEVTPATAGTWLEDLKYPRQRPMADWHVKQLTEAMRTGRFVKGTQIRFDVCDSTGRRYLVDGQHRLKAVVNSGVTVEFIVVENHVLTEDEVDRDYYRIDVGRKRGPADAYRAVRVDEATGLTPTQLNGLGAATELIASNFYENPTGTRMELDARLPLIIEWAPVMIRYCGLTSGVDGQLLSRLMRSSTLSVALVTLRHHPDTRMAEEFWRQVAHDDGLRVGDARKLLHEWLLSFVTLSGSGSSTGHAITKRRAVYYVVKAWNTFATGRVIPWLRIQDKELNNPVSIAGTPYSLSPRHYGNTSASRAARNGAAAAGAASNGAAGAASISFVEVKHK